MSKAIFKMSFDYGRSGTLYGIFIADKDAVKELTESGREVYFGEVLGKHSDVCGPVGCDEITLVSDDEKIVADFERLEMATGYNPFDYIDESEDESA